MSTSRSGGMRAKLDTVEDTLTSHSSALNNHTNRVLSLEQQTTRIAAYIDEKMDELRKECARTISSFKEDAEHKFSMQYAENKRLNVTMSKQKKENQVLMDRIKALENRCAVLEAELGND